MGLARVFSDVDAFVGWAADRAPRAALSPHSADHSSRLFSALGGV
jgi:hypothetical protein